MKYNIFTLTNQNQSSTETEISFSVASARAEKVAFLKLVLPNNEADKAESNAIKVLKALKKQGRIELYINANELSGDSTEAEYLRNKFPKIHKLCDDNCSSLIVKI